MNEPTGTESEVCKDIAKRQAPGVKPDSEGDEKCLVCGAPEPCSHDFDKERENMRNL